MIKLLVKVVLQLVFWKPKKWRKGFKAKLESMLYSVAIRRRAKSCGKDLYILGPGVNVTSNTTIGDGAGFGKRVKGGEGCRHAVHRNREPGIRRPGPCGCGYPDQGAR